MPVRPRYEGRHRRRRPPRTLSPVVPTLAASLTLAIAAAGALAVPQGSSSAAADGSSRAATQAGVLLALAGRTPRDERASRSLSRVRPDDAQIQRAAESASAAAAAQALAAQQAAAQAAAEAARPTWVRPVEGYRISGIFGERRSGRTHAGLDLAAPTGTPVVAAADGVVVSTGSEGAYGLMVVVDHGNGVIIRYPHLSSIAVDGGQVSVGQLIGEVGNTGRSTGPHLHLEVRIQDEAVDPRPWFAERGVEF